MSGNTRKLRKKLRTSNCAFHCKTDGHMPVRNIINAQHSKTVGEMRNKQLVTYYIWIIQIQPGCTTQ